MGDSPKRKSLAFQVSAQLLPETGFLGMRLLRFGPRNFSGGWGVGDCASFLPREYPQGLYGFSSERSPNGLSDLWLITHSSGSKAKDEESCWGCGHPGKV